MPLTRPLTRAARRIDLPVTVATLTAIVPIVVAAVDALGDGWIAIGDNGYFLLRSRDVFTEHTPLLGTWTSSSTELGFDVNNPGPMLFFLLAIPVKIGESAGLVVGIATMNIACIVAIAYVLRRNAGSLVAVLGIAAAAGLSWSMGRPLLIDPWQPHSLLFPFICFLVLAWVVAAGDRGVLPWAVGVASLLVQSHLSYVYVVPVVGLVAVACFVAGALDHRRRAPAHWPEERAGLLRVGLVSAGVALVCWMPTLIEQFVTSGRGNLTLLAEASRAGAPTVGAAVGIREAASVLAIWPTWLRPSFDQEHPVDVGLATSIVALLALSAILAAAAWWSWRSRDRFGLAGIVVAGTAAVTGTYTATGLVDTVFDVAAHHVRYLWPIAIVVQLAVAVVAARSLGEVGARRALVVGIAVVVTLAIAAVPNVERARGPNFDREVTPAIQSMIDGMGPLEDRGTVLVDFEGRSFAEPFSGPFLAELGRRDVDFVIDDSGEVRQLGVGRSADGRDDLAGTIVLRWGRGALLDAPDGEEIVVASVLDPTELDEWWSIREKLLDAVASGALRRTEAGVEAASSGNAVPEPGVGIGNPSAVVDTYVFMRALEKGWIALDSVPPDLVANWIALDARVQSGTVGIWLLPAGS